MSDRINDTPKPAIPIRSLLFVVILLIGAFLRFWFLGEIPLGVTNDESGSLYSSYSVVKTGRSLDGTYLPLSFNLDNSYAPTGVYLAAPSVLAFGVSAFALRFPFALLATASIAVLYVLAGILFESSAVALFAAAVFALSPWHIHMNHGAYDGPITLLFLIAVTVFIRNVKQGNILWFLPWFLVSFYTYHATKVLWVVYLPFLFIVYRREIWEFQKKRIIPFIAVVLCIGLSFWYVLRTQHVTRQQVLMVPSAAALTRSVDEERTKNIAPEYMRRVFSNKAVVLARNMMGNYMQAFTPQFLFTNGEGGIYGTYRHGVLYVIDIFFLCMGFVFLARTRRIRERNFIIGSLLLAPLPSAVTSDISYSLRGIHMLPFFSLLIGLGWYQTFRSVQVFGRPRRIIIKTVLIVLYALSVINFIYIYFFQYSIYGAEYWFKSSKDVAALVGAARKDFSRVYIAQAGKMFMFQYGIVNHIPLSEITVAWNSSPPYKIGNVHLLDDCLTRNTVFDPESELPPSTLYITRESCHTGSTPSATVRDWGEPLRTIWNIYEHR